MSFGCGKSLLSLLKARKIFKVAHICIRQGMYEKRVEKNRTKKYLKFPLFLYCEQGKSRVGKFKIKILVFFGLKERLIGKIKKARTSKKKK